MSASSNSPAFPWALAWSPGQESVGDTGMTKRELFAAMAMHGILSGWSDEDTHNPALAAQISIAHADALLAELAIAKATK